MGIDASDAPRRQGSITATFLIFLALALYRPFKVVSQGLALRVVIFGDEGAGK